MRLIHIQRFICLAFLVAASSALALPSYAESEPAPVLPTVHTDYETQKEMGVPTHPDLRITPDKSEIVRLKSDVASVIIGNPLHVNVIADSSRTLVVVPRSPGATHFIALGRDGNVLMQRHVIVASPKKDYIRVKRVCAADAENCQTTSVFYCPDMCHEVGLQGMGEDTSGGDAAEAAASAADGSDTADTE